jgi:hypothetical protein
MAAVLSSLRRVAASRVPPRGVRGRSLVFRRQYAFSRACLYCGFSMEIHKW